MTTVPLRRRSPFGAAGDRGSVTAESAWALPALVGVAMVLIAAVAWSAQYVRAVDAASAIAHAVARGESPTAVADLAARVTPEGASVQTHARGDRIHVTVNWRPQSGPASWMSLAPEISAAAEAFTP